MPRTTLTYGEMPTRAQFDDGWDQTTGHVFTFGNDERLGNCSMTRDELWEELERAWNEYADQLGHPGSLSRDPEKLGSWLADVLHCLGIEWV
jgi:hypothetical protein